MTDVHNPTWDQIVEKARVARKAVDELLVVMNRHEKDDYSLCRFGCDCISNWEEIHHMVDDSKIGYVYLSLMAKGKTQ